MGQGEGNDSVFGGETGYDQDFLYLNAASGGVTVTFTGSEAGSWSFGSGGTGSFSEIEILTATDQNDTIDASASASGMNLNGGAGNDSVTGGTGNDKLYGGSGNDTVSGGAGDDTVQGDAGNDLLYGGSGNDWLLSVSGEDTLYGGAGDDYLVSGTGSTSLDGGSGNDTVYGGYYASTLMGGDGDDTVAGGNGGGDRIYGGAGNDSLSGNGGSDTLHGGAGADLIDGGTGTDTADYTGSGAAVAIDLGAGTASGGDAAGDTLTGIENLVGSSFNDSLTGGAGNDQLSGRAGDDLLHGGAGNDSLWGDEGSDTLYGGAGNDMMQGGGDADVLHVAGGEGVDAVYGGESGTDLDWMELSDGGTGQGVAVTFGGWEWGSYSFTGGGSGQFWEIEHVSGTAYDDTIIGAGGGALWLEGGAGNDRITGGDGADTLSGGAGNDTLTGGLGADTLAGGSGNDSFVLIEAGGHDVVQDFDIGDPDLDGFTNDRLDVSDLVDGQGNPVKTFDVAISDDGSGNTVLTFPGGEQVTLLGLAPATAAQPGMLHAMGIPCFASGTRILTPDGARPVEEIVAGDLLVTGAGQALPVLWHGQRRLDRAALEDQPHLRPIRLRAGRFGNRRDLVVSPLHAVWVAGRLIRARHLADWGQGARVARGIGAVTYHHLLLPRHALIRAEGALTESFYPGRMALAALTAPDRAQVLRILARLGPYPPCQPVLGAAEARAWLRTAIPAPA